LVGWPADREGGILTVVTDEGARFLDYSGNERKVVHFSERVVSPVELARTDSAGNYVFLTRDQSWAVAVILFDEQGRKRWSYPDSGLNLGVDDAAVLEEDGWFLGVVVGFNGSGGVTLLDADRNVVW
jgi:hypothetical protein